MAQAVATSESTPRARAHAGDGLVHPLPLLAVVVLLFNDHWLKQHYPGWLSGKLSDFAGMIFFPLLLQGLWEVGAQLLRRPWQPSRRVLLVSIVATGLVFSLVQLSERAASAYRIGLGALQWLVTMPWAALSGNPLGRPAQAVLTRDPTDLVALVALAAAWWVGTARRRT
jgi:hypothetical protein